MSDRIVGAVYHAYQSPQAPDTLVLVPTSDGWAGIPLIDFLQQRLAEVESALAVTDEANLVALALLRDERTYYQRRIQYFATC